MAVDVMARFFFRKDLSSTEILVGLAIGDSANEEGVCWPAVATIAEKVNLSERAIQKTLSSLEAKMLLRRVTRRDRSSYYILVLENLPRVERPRRVKERGPHEDHTGERSAPHPDLTGERRSRTGESGSRTGERGAPRNVSETSEDSPPSPNGEGTPTDDLFGNEAGKELAEHVPTLEEVVVEGWHALKRDHPGIVDIDVLNDSRRKAISARASEVVRARRQRGQQITPEDVWAEVFAAIRRSTFLCGRAPPGKGRTSAFKLNINYVLRQSEFLKILEGSYDDGPGNRRSFDERTGREFGPAEQATRDAVSSLYASHQR